MLALIVTGAIAVGAAAARGGDAHGQALLADIRDYEAVHHHILEMADMLSNGIMRQFPQRFR